MRQVEQQITASYILYALYAPHSIALNPFKSVLVDAFYRERMDIGVSFRVNEQLVWVLWKILHGHGNDIGPYSPSTLCRSPLPVALRPTQLWLEEEEEPTSAPPPPPTLAEEEELDPLYSVTYEGQVISPEYISWQQDEQRAQTAKAIQLLLIGRERALNLHEQSQVLEYFSNIEFSHKPFGDIIHIARDLPPLITYNPSVSHALVVLLFRFNDENLATMVDVLAGLEPTLPVFDVLGRLLKDKSVAAPVVKAEVLGTFMSRSVRWVEDGLKEAPADDRYDKALVNVSSSLPLRHVLVLTDGFCFV